MKVNQKVIYVNLLLCLLILSSCSDNRTVVPEDQNSDQVNSVWNCIIVTGSVVNLRSGPGTEYSILGQAREGDSLQVTGGLDDWYRIYVPDMSLFAWIYGPLTSGTELP